MKDTNVKLVEESLLNSIELNKERKVINRKAKEIKRVKHYYSKSTQFSSITNELPSVYLNNIITGDSLDELKKLPNNCIDLVFTSPPYNFGLDYENEKDDSIFWDTYFNQLFQIFAQCIRVLKYGGGGD